MIELLYKDPEQKKITIKELDTETGLYYYGARYLEPKTSRWLSADPALGEYLPSAPVNDEARKRNGSLPGQGGVFNYVNMHVYHYAGNNPVKYVDPDGRVANFIIGAVVGFVSSAAIETCGRMATGQNLGGALKSTFTSGKSWAIMGASTGIGALTSGVSGIAVNVATKGATTVAQVAVTTVAINTASGAIDAAAKDIAVKAITGQPQDLKDTAIVAGKGAISAGLTSGLTQTAIATGSARSSQVVNVLTGSETNVRIQQPEWAGSMGVVGENIVPTTIDLAKEAAKVIRTREE